MDLAKSLSEMAETQVCYVRDADYSQFCLKWGCAMSQLSDLRNKGNSCLPLSKLSSVMIVQCTEDIHCKSGEKTNSTQPPAADPVLPPHY